MAKIYTVRQGGKIFKIRGPDNATPEMLKAHLAQQKTSAEPRGKVIAAETAKQAALAPFTQAKEAAVTPFTAPEKVTKLGTSTPLLPIAGATLGGPIGGALGETARQAGKVVMGEPAAQPWEIGANVMLASLASPVASKTLKTAEGMQKVGKVIAAPSLEQAKRTLETVKTGLPTPSRPPWTPKEVAQVVENAPKVADMTATIAKYKGLPKQALIDITSLMGKAYDRIAKLHKVGKIHDHTFINFVKNKEAADQALREVYPELGKANQDYARAMAAESLKGLKGAIPGVGGWLEKVGRRSEAVRRALKNVK